MAFQAFQLAFLGFVEPEFVDVPEPGYAETINSSDTSFYTAPEGEGGSDTSSTHSTDSIGSQHTVHGQAAQDAMNAAPTQPNGEEDEPSEPKYGGLDKDAEGAETRKQMLERRRKECKAEEVDVALAPTLKINVPYVFYPDQYKRFRDMFPKVTPDSGLAYTHHDHPVAHTATMVGTRHIQNRLGAGELVLDIGGNPTGNENFNRFQNSRNAKRPHLPKGPKIESLVGLNTSADSVRLVTKWGPRHGKNNEVRYKVGTLDDITPKLYDKFIMIHTLYYYSMYEINALMAKNQGAQIMALVNYAPDQCGKLYGELEYSKNDGVTHQVSPNGESYNHPDIDKWFQCSSFRGQSEHLGSGIAWTSQNIGGPMYVITIASCPWNLARRHVYEPPHAPTLQVGRGGLFFGWFRMGDTNVRLNISNHGLACELRHFMTLRDRANPQTFLDLCVKARRITSPDLVLGTRQFTVADGELSDHIVYAYLVDAPGELELLEGVKLLRGDLLAPHSSALKLDGKDNVHGFFTSTWFYQNVISRPAPEAALGARSKANRALFERTKPPNSGGLLPTKRT